MKTGNPRPAVSEILLVRHGRSTYRSVERWLDAAGVRRFEEGYNAAGIRDDSLPSDDLLATASAADVLAASEMIRAVESARRLVPGREPEICPHLHEITLEVPRWLRVPLPIFAWDLISHSLVSWTIARNRNHEFVRRADAAADWLIQRATGSARVVAVTHGGFRRFLDARLVRRGWRRTHTRTSYENWSTWSYTVSA